MDFVWGYVKRKEHVMQTTVRIGIAGALCAWLLVGEAAGLGGRHRRRCETAPAPCCEEEQAAPAMVERTIMVPQTSTEMRTVKSTVYEREQREKTVTVIERVPKTETVTKAFTAWVAKQFTRQVTYDVCKPVTTEETQEYTVCVPHRETREGTRVVCRRVAVPRTRTVTVDEGHWEEVAASESPCASGCDEPCGRRCGRRWHRRSCGCGDVQTAACRVWVPNLVQKEIHDTVCRTVREEQPYTYEVTVMKPETRSRTVQQTRMVKEQQTRDVTYTKCVPEQRSKTYEVTRVECVPTEKTVTYQVCVPRVFEKQVEVQVVKMVPKTVLVPEDCGGCGHGRRARRCRGC
jgi:hypothetical protein